MAGFDPVSLAVTVALSAAQMALQMSRRIEGPRLDNLDVTVADYGTPLNYFYGKIRFSAVPIIWAEPIREVKRRSKTKAGKNSEYSYFGSFGVVVADHPIEAVTRIWFDKHLVYDVTGAGPLHPFIIGTTQTANKGKGTRQINIDLGEHLRIYLGTETQTADPRMLADVEAKHGAGSCPDYKGVAYIVFEEIPLEKFGNRVPQISVEAVSAAIPAYPWETFPVALNNSRLWNTVLSKDGNWLMWSWTDGTYEIWYLPTRTRMRSGNAGIEISYFRDGGIDYRYDGSLIGISGGAVGGLSLFTMTSEGVVSSFITNYFGAGAGDQQTTMQVMRDGDDFEHWATTSAPLTSDYFWLDGVRYHPTTMGYSGRATFWLADAFGDIWVVLIDNNPVPNIRFVKMVDTSGRGAPTAVTVGAGLPNAGSSYPYAAAIHYGDDAHDHFVLAWEGNLYAVDCFTGAIIASNTSVLYDVYNGDGEFKAFRPGSPTIWLGGPGGGSLVQLSDLTEIDTFAPSSWKPLEDTDGFLHVPVLNAIIGWPAASNVMTIYYLDRPDSDGVTLEAVINDVSGKCNVDPTLVDASEMDQLVNYAWTRGTGRDVLEPLLEIHDSIVRPHDFGLEFIKLGRSSLGTISSAYFVAEKGKRAEFDVVIEQDTDLPRRVTVSYADLTADQQPNVAVAQRDADTMDGVRELTINLSTYASSPDAMQPLTERWLRRRWFEREGYRASVPAHYLGIEPGDVYDIDLDGLEKRGRVSGVTIEKRGVLKLELRRDDPLVATLSNSAGQSLDGHLDEVMIIPMPTKAFILDTTLIRDLDESSTPFLYIGAGPAAAGTWLGATIYEARDGVHYDTEVAAIPSYFPADWGYCVTALYDVESAGLWDRGEGMNVRIATGSLTSITEAEADADPLLNRIIFETGEQVQFTVATLEADGSYTITGMKRGRRGTEWATGLHYPGEAFIFADGVLTDNRGASDIASNLYFKARGAADALEAMEPRTIAFSANAHRPYAPANLEASKDASGDWIINAIRRTRTGGAWTGGGTIPLGETAEAYELDLSDGVTTVTKEISSFPFTWTAAAQTTDMGGSVGVGSLDVTAYQMSDLAGRGFPATGSF